MTPNDHYFSPDPSSEINYYTLYLKNLRGHDFILTTASGVFSPKKLDKGTELLIKNARFIPGSNILDLGCGYGVVGLTICLECPQCRVIMTDINSRATKLAKKNAFDLKVRNAEVYTGNLYTPIESINIKFDTILSNPPQAAGKQICAKIIHDAPLYLKTDGVLQLVGRQQKGGKFYLKEMRETFQNGEIVSRKSGYSVYLAKKNS